MDELRRACAQVAARARSVRIDDAALAGYAASLPAPRGPGEDETPEGLRTRAQRAAYWLTLDAINFGSGWFPTLRKPEGRSGYATVSRAWRRHHEAEGPLPADALARITPTQIATILDQDPGHELMGLFAASLSDLGTRLRDEHDGSVLALLDAAEGSAVTFASRLGSWSCFADCSRYEGLAMPFLKRAQIAAADLQRAGVVRWDDAPRLTMFADNLVPHVLRLDGVLHFDPSLVARIDAGELIEHGSPEEVEIRACAVEAVERIVAARGDATTAADIDALLWTRGSGSRYKASPRHRSRCTAY